VRAERGRAKIDEKGGREERMNRRGEGVKR